MTLPKHWERSNVGQIATILRGVSYPKNSATNIPSENSVLILRGGNIQDGKIVVDADRVYVPNSFIDQSQYLKKGDVIIVASTGSKALIGKAAISLRDEPYIAFGAFLMLLRPSNVVDGAFFGYFFLTDEYRFNIRRLSAGININNIRRDHISGMRIPIPPLPEQKLIAAKLDKLFGHLDRIRERLDKIPALLKQFRQAVLTQAVTGKLTEEWRKRKKLSPTSQFLDASGSNSRTEPPFEIDSWCWKPIASLAKIISGYAFKSSEFQSQGYPLIRMGNLFRDRLDLTKNPVFISSDCPSSIIGRYSVKDGDVLLTLTGTKYKRDYGYSVIIENCGSPILLNQRIVAMRPVINGKYLLYLTRSDIFRDQFFSLETGGVNQGNVSVSGLASILLPIPTLEEQTEIVRRVEALLRIADQIEERYETIRNRINQLPQAILNKAFRGELLKGWLATYEAALN